MKTRRFKKDIPPEKGEETGIAMDNMKPSGSCPEKIEVVVVVVVVVVVFFVVLGFLLHSINYNKEGPAATTPL